MEKSLIDVTHWLLFSNSTFIVNGMFFVVLWLVISTGVVNWVQFVIIWFYYSHTHMHTYPCNTHTHERMNILPKPFINIANVLINSAI